ncbi:lysophospholipid acyltransferase family protein [Jannaschia sp. LMIT008]|uniref:lysophospholipid acyltransferase family protein n=1 Tax=Jannaschia maritima TaxID=3032585 RepID=UPI0028121C28|nr:lysophospholipid acyltransferase family protein [Jannaschia sp. LMIT008]
MQTIRSLIFNTAMYLWMAIIAVGFAPWALVSDRGARAACRAYCRGVLAMMTPLTGIAPDIRGTPPAGQVIVAAKHQSFLDILMLFDALPHAFFIMKDVLRFVPLMGTYAVRMGCIPVKRGRRAEAIKGMLDDLRRGDREPGQLVIYPQGTRTAPGARMPFKAGIFAIYEQTGQPVVPAATNVGLFWPRGGIRRRPGRAVVAFLDPIPPGLDRPTFMARLEEAVEGASNRLMVEGGFPADRLTAPDPDAIAAREAVR